MQKETRTRTRTVVHAAAIDQDHCSQEELDTSTCRKELAEV